jgi:hypothetical protein
MNVFTLARMRRLDLLALWHQLHQAGREHDGLTAGRMSGDWLVTSILQAREPHP